MNTTLAWQKLCLAACLGAFSLMRVGAQDDPGLRNKFVPPERPVPLEPLAPVVSAPGPNAIRPIAPRRPITAQPGSPLANPSLVTVPPPIGTQLGNPNPGAPVPVPVAPPPPQQPATYLAWDADSKELAVKSTEQSAHFTFWLTNVSKEVVMVNSVRTSCGCTVAQLPEQPWHLQPGTNGPIEVSVNLLGKSGLIMKSVTADTTAGIKTLMVKVNIAPPDAATSAVPGPVNSGDAERNKNMAEALKDRQVVFKNQDCAKCHAEPATDKNGLAVMGEKLYQGVCANCHDSPNRASAVPNLHALTHPTNPAHWKQWIVSGRAGSMMPAFAKTEGGILTDEQVSSLVDYLSKAIPSNPQPPNAAQPLPVPKPNQSASAAPVGK